ncbi:hypothetical protein [Lysinibacillus fusiformis]|uniref:hypothetical protein n=1 Tax=Lysinibacillus fusiformis TaxID=28031 RepID=UPI0020C04636|nr:hypothetical protein [Lysinibacillus fusiformis]
MTISELEKEVSKDFPVISNVSIDQTLDSYARSTVYLSFSAPIGVLNKLIVSSNGGNRFMMITFNVDGNKVILKSDAVINMYPLLEYITK